VEGSSLGSLDGKKLGSIEGPILGYVDGAIVANNVGNFDKAIVGLDVALRILDGAILCAIMLGVNDLGKVGGAEIIAIEGVSTTVGGRLKYCGVKLGSVDGWRVKPEDGDVALCESDGKFDGTFNETKLGTSDSMTE